MKFKVFLWNGAGYGLHVEEVETLSNDATEAVEVAVASLEQSGLDSFFFDDLDEDERESDSFLYVDSTCQGGGCHYIDATNLRVEAV